MTFQEIVQRLWLGPAYVAQYCVLALQARGVVCICNVTKHAPCVRPGRRREHVLERAADSMLYSDLFEYVQVKVYIYAHTSL
jgi:hypothetical protein